MSESNLHQLLKPVQRRLAYIFRLRVIMIGAVLGLLAACIWLVAARWLPIEHYRLIALLWIGAGLLGGLIYSWLHRISLQQAAQVMDAYGLEERVSTALHYAEDDSAIAVLQRQDAEAQASAFLPRLHEHLELPSMRRWFISIAALFGCFFLLQLWSNPMDEVLQQQEAERQWIAEQVELVEEMKEEILEQAAASSAQQSMLALLEQLQLELAEADQALEALERIEQGLQQLEELQKELAKEEQKAEQWVQQWQQLEQQLQALPQLSEAQRQQLANEIKDLAAALPELGTQSVEQLREELQKAAGELAESPDFDMEALNRAIADAMEQMQQQAALQNAVAQQGQQLAQAGLPMAEQLAAQGVRVSNNWGAGGIAERLAAGTAGGPQTAVGNADGEAGGSSDGGSSSGSAGEGTGETAGSAGGSGDGNGSGGAGSGAGNGSGAGSGGGSGMGAGSGSGGTGAGLGSGSRNLIYSPRELAGEGDIHSDQGPVTGEGGDMEYGGSSPMLDGASRPYEEVYVQYADEAKDSLARSSLPYHMQNLVRDYFIEIQPDRQ